MKNLLKLHLLSVMTMAVFTACTDTIDNPANTALVNGETPEQQAFWARFDAWQTDSCTLGDDFYMHMIGTWWKNPVDIYPNGMIAYAETLNNERLREIIYSEPNMAKMVSHYYDKLTMSDDEVELMVNAKVDELWAGATTRDEALAALGRAWAQGYALYVMPMVNLVNGVPTWQLDIKFPSYVNIDEVYSRREEFWKARAQRQNARMKTRAEQQAVSDLDKIIKGMNIGIDHIEIREDVQALLKNQMEMEWNTVENIKNQIAGAVRLLDGAIVNDSCVATYNDYLRYILPQIGATKQIELSRADINYHVVMFMGNLYMLNAYNQQYISPAMRQKYTKWCEQFRDAMRQRLETNTWLEEETRQNALKKLEKVVFYVGAIDQIPDCVIPTLTGQTLIDDARQLRKTQIDGYCWASTKKREEVALLLYQLLMAWNYTEVNASYNTNLNIATIYPSYLCSPQADEDNDDALIFAIHASTIGHELTHGFDSNGSQYDMWGNETNWWTEADAAKFKALCNQLVDRYNQLQLMPWVDPTLYADGEKTLAENIADLGGCSMALQILLNEHPSATDEEKAALTRRFFQGWAIWWGSTYNIDFVKYMKEVDVHSQARERINGVVRNMDEWYDAYGIKSGSLYLQPADRVHIW